jgi:glycine dehydrogenase
MDRLCDALIQIRKDVAQIETGEADKDNNPIKNAPHTMDVVCADNWNRPYHVNKQPSPYTHDDKYWPTVSKVDG